MAHIIAGNFETIKQYSVFTPCQGSAAGVAGVTENRPFPLALIYHTETMADPVTKSSTELLQNLDQKKRVLEEVMHVAQTIERLQQGLQAVLLMGKTTHSIPRQALQLFKKLGEKLRGHPVNELMPMLHKLEEAIRNDVGQILQLAVIDDAGLLEMREQPEQGAAAVVEDVGRLAENFRRRVQTAVYLRVLLGEQGVDTAPLQLAVPAEQIQQQIEVLDERSRRCRLQVQEQVTSMLTDVQVLMLSETIPEPLKEHLRSVQAELQANLKHLESGRPVDEIPFEVEAFLLESEEPLSFEAPKPAQPEEAGSRPSNKSHAEGNRVAPPGFFRCLWTWCLTPTHVSWTEIRSGRYRPRKRKR